MSNNTQPDWSNAPKGAEYAGWAESNRSWCWYKDFDGKGNYKYRYDRGPKWHESTAPRPQHAPLIPRPKPEQGWENGVPPADDECEVFIDGDTWVRARVVGHHGPLAVCFVLDGEHDPEYQAFPPKCIRPLRSPRDRAIDAAVKEYAESNLSDYFVTAAGTIKQIAGLWYDAGLLREVE